MPDNLAVNAAFWEVSEQGNVSKSKVPICARCHEPFEIGALRIKPSNTRNTRYCHVECSKGLISSIQDISNKDVLGLAMTQRVTRALSVAANRTAAPGDTPVADISDSRHEEMTPLRPIVYELKNLKAIDNISWKDIACCPPTIRDIPKHWFFSFAEAKHAVAKSVLATDDITDPAERQLTTVRLWKLIFMIDAMLFHKPPKLRGGKRGQGAATLNVLFTNRLRSFWSGDWVPLWTEVEATIVSSTRSTAAKSRSLESNAKRLVQEVEAMIQHEAISRALGKVNRPLRFAQGVGVPEQLRNMYPQPQSPASAQPFAPPPTEDLAEELVGHILKELGQLPSMAGAGANGSYFEHLQLHTKIAGGADTLASVLAQLVTGKAPPEVVQWFRSGRSHPLLKDDSDVDIRPLTAPTSAWRCALRAWARMFKEEVIHATGNTQFGCGQSGGAAALRHSLEAALLANPTKALLSVDIKNMHGSLEVDNIERQVLTNTPRLWPLLAPWIRSARVHIYRDDSGALHEIAAENPLDQGCPSSSLLACISAIPLHNEMKTHGDTFGFQDDTYVLTEPHKARECLRQVPISVAAMGCQVNQRKTMAWCTTALDVQGLGIAQVPELPPVMKQPLSIFLATHAQGFEITSSESVRKLVGARQFLYDKLAELRRFGLTL